MTSQPESVPGLATLAEQVRDLQNQVMLLQLRLKKAGITDDVNLAERFEQLAATVAEALTSILAARTPAPRWTGLDSSATRQQMEALAGWVETILLTEYKGYDLRPCWDSHIHVVWELSTVAAEWHRIYGVPKPSLDRALDFYDRFLPHTMTRVGEYLRKCEIQCILER